MSADNRLNLSGTTVDAAPLTRQELMLQQVAVMREAFAPLINSRCVITFDASFVNLGDGRGNSNREPVVIDVEPTLALQDHGEFYKARIDTNHAKKLTDGTEVNTLTLELPEGVNLVKEAEKFIVFGKGVSVNTGKIVYYLPYKSTSRGIKLVAEEAIVAIGYYTFKMSRTGKFMTKY